MNLRIGFVMVAAVAVGCGGSGKGTSTGPVDQGADMGRPAVPGEHGVIVDYFSNMPMVGFTVTDGDNSVTTGADGSFLLPVAVGGKIAPVVSGPMYGTLYLGEGVAVAPAADHGVVPEASAGNIMLEQSILANDTSKAVVHVAVLRRGACPTLVGGTITVNAPAGAKVAYFSTAGLPTAPTLSDIVPNRPAALLYDLDPGVALDVTINVPDCTQVNGADLGNGIMLTGQVRTLPMEPGDVVSALELVVE